MSAHFNFYDRVLLQNYIEDNPRCSAIEVAGFLGKSRSTIYYELKNFTNVFAPRSVSFNHGSVLICSYLKRFPFCCNNCAKIKCSHRSRHYDAYVAQDKAMRLLVNSRMDTKHRKDTADILDKTVSQLIIDGVSIKVAMLSVNRCDVSESTIRRYVNNGYLLARRHHLPNSVRFKVKKEYNYSRKRINVKHLYGRTYQDYLNYTKAYPKTKVIQIDSVQGKANDKHALLTIFFLNSKFQLAIKYRRQHSNVNDILLELYSKSFKFGYKLFDVVLADNGSEFFRLPEIEKTEDDIWRCKVFYCDPYRSCQKAECERNHGFIRRFFPKKKSLDSLSQETLDMALSHINSYPRGSLNNRTPYDLFSSEYDSIIASSFEIDKIELTQLRIKQRI